jgi:hypothetical protein
MFTLARSPPGETFLLLPLLQFAGEFWSFQRNWAHTKTKTQVLVQQSDHFFDGRGHTRIRMFFCGHWLHDLTQGRRAARDFGARKLVTLRPGSKDSSAPDYETGGQKVWPWGIAGAGYETTVRLMAACGVARRGLSFSPWSSTLSAGSDATKTLQPFPVLAVGNLRTENFHVHWAGQVWASRTATNKRSLGGIVDWPESDGVGGAWPNSRSNKWPKAGRGQLKESRCKTSV